MEQEFYHEPVLLKEATGYLLHNNETSINKVYVDGTLGGGGYLGDMLNLTANETQFIAIDRDVFSIEYCKKNLRQYLDRITFVQDNFSKISEILTGSFKKLRKDKISGLILDLGLSSYQLNSEPGFSYQIDTQLDMRADKSQQLTAADVLNTYDEMQLAKIFRDYGELRYSRNIAKDIMNYRRMNKMKSTFDLVNAVKERIPGRFLNKDLSKIFQAVRIEVNDELENLSNCLRDVVKYLENGARIVVISYHSLEDRIVKNFFKETDKLKPVLKKPLTASEEEIDKNSRARSAKLRIAEKIEKKP